MPHTLTDITPPPAPSAPQARARTALAQTLVMAALMGTAATASALTVTLDAIETGQYSPGLLATPDYTTGITLAFGGETRGYLVFDLTPTQALGGSVTAATLLIANGSSYNQVGPNEPLPLRVYALPEAHAGNFGRHAGGGGGGNFGYIGSNSATLFAQQDVLAADSGTLLEVPISVAGVGHLDASRSNDFYAYGLKIIKADAQEPKPLQYVFGGSASPGNQVQLVLQITSAVPEPHSAWLLLAGLPLLAWRRHRRVHLGSAR